MNMIPTTDAGSLRQASIGALLFDMDGVIYRGDTLIPEVPAFLAALDAAGVMWSMATNNATKTQLDYVQKLAGMGIDAPESRIVTSAIATASYLRHLSLIHISEPTRPY